MKTYNDYLVEFLINGVLIQDYIAYVNIEEYVFHRIGGDENSNRENPLTLDEFKLLCGEEDLQNLYTEEEKVLYFTHH